jgi:hypothetical protein
MSTEQEDTALMLQLEEKITARIRTEIRDVILGVDAGPYDAGSLTSQVLHERLMEEVRVRMQNDSAFARAMANTMATRLMTTTTIHTR